MPAPDLEVYRAEILRRLEELKVEDARGKDAQKNRRAGSTSCQALIAHGCAAKPSNGEGTSHAPRGATAKVHGCSCTHRKR